MKLEKLPSGSYRAQKMYKGKRYRITFDHKPTEKELTIAFAEKMQDNPDLKGKFESFALEYIDDRKYVASPATIRTYNIKLKQLSKEFKSLNIYDIDNVKVQREINQFSKTHEPKTTKTLYGFINSVLTAYRPNLRLKITLPQHIHKEVYEPTSEDVKRILESVKGTKYSVPFQLGVMGCRRAEICALDLNDLTGNELRIHRSKVYLDGKWLIKETPKTDASNRTLFLPDKLVNEIKENGCIFNGYPAALYKAIQSQQKKLGIPRFKFHALRSYFASYAHSMGIPEADILAIGGWQTSSVMKQIYRKSMDESKQKSLNKYTTSMFSE